MNGIMTITIHRNVLRTGLLCAALAVRALFPSSSQAYLQSYDGFNYASNINGTIDGFNGGTGWDAGWGLAGLGGAASEILLPGSLSDPSGLLYTSSNHVFSYGGLAGRYFSPNLPNWAVPGVNYYFSILIRPENTPAANHYYGMQLFSNNQGPTGNGHDLFIGKTGSGLNYGLEYSTNSIVGNTTNTVFFDSYSSTAAVSNQPVLLVVRVVFSGVGPYSFALYVNPTPGGSEPATPDATITDDIGTQNGLALNSGNGGLVSFDEIRIGTTFASVTPASAVPDPNLQVWEPFAYSACSVLAGQNGGAGWDSVSWGQFYPGDTSVFTNLSGSLADPTGMLLASGGRTTTGGGFGGRYPLLTNYIAGTSYGTPGTTNYYSILIRPEASVTPSNYWGMQLRSNNGGNDLFVGKNGSGLYYGLEYSTNDITGASNVFVHTFSSLQAASNQTAFLVVRVDFLPGGTNDLFRLYVNPTPGNAEPAIPAATLSGYLGLSDFNGIAFNCGDNGSGGTRVSFDEVRTGTTFADVTPPAMHIQSITRSGNDVSLSWTAAVGTTNVVQVTTNASGSFNANSFVNAGTFVIPGSSGPIVTNPPAIGSVIATNFIDSFGATNKARYYRVQQLGP